MENTLAGRPLFITLDTSAEAKATMKAMYLDFAAQYKTHSFAVVYAEVGGARRICLTSKKRGAK